MKKALWQQQLEKKRLLRHRKSIQLDRSKIKTRWIKRVAAQKITYNSKWRIAKFSNFSDFLILAHSLPRYVCVCVREWASARFSFIHFDLLLPSFIVSVVVVNRGSFVKPDFSMNYPLRMATAVFELLKTANIISVSERVCGNDLDFERCEKRALRFLYPNKHSHIRRTRIQTLIF